MKFVLLLISILTLLGCSGGSSDPINIPVTEADPMQPIPPEAPSLPLPPEMSPDIQEFHRELYSAVTRSVSYGDVLNLNYEPSTQKRFYGEDSLQFVEYWPAQNTQQRQDLANIVLIHGGCWSNRFRLAQSYPMATALSLNGFPVWSIEYRATGDEGGGWPGTYTDIESAIRFIYQQIYSQSQSKIRIVGHSAGGHLALLARTNLDLDFNVVGLAAITNLITYADQEGSCNSLAVSFMNGRPADLPEQYTLANPQTGSLSAQAFLFGGGQDGIVDESQVRCTGITFQIDEDAGHFDWIHPGTASFEHLLNYLLTE